MHLNKKIGIPCVPWDSHTNGTRDNDYIIGMEMETKSWELEGTDIRQLFPHISSAVMFRSGISGCNTWLCCNDQPRHLFTTFFFWKHVKHNAAFHSKSRSANIWTDSIRFTLPVWEWTEASKTGLRTKAIKRKHEKCFRAANWRENVVVVVII